MSDLRIGDSYSLDLEAWGKRKLLTSPETNQYNERIALYDGSVLVSEALLSDHRD